LFGRSVTGPAQSSIAATMHVTRVTRTASLIVRSSNQIFTKQPIGEDIMSTIADREAYRPRKSVSQPTASRPELFFWAALALIGVAVIAAAFAGSSFAAQVPPETFFVGP
jgi:hypothetical protein